MPWSVKHKRSDCPAGKPWAVVQDDTGEIAGCHPTQTDANAQKNALYANVEESK